MMKLECVHDGVGQGSDGCGCLHSSRYGKKDAFRLVLTGIAGEVLIHRYVYDEELLSSEVKHAMESLVSEGIVRVMDPEERLCGEALHNYHHIAHLFGHAFGVNMQNARSTHMGEVVTVALAKAMGIRALLSNEHALEREIMETINSGMDDNKVYRMKDIVTWIRDTPTCGLGRRDAKIIWLLSFSKERMNEKKDEFERMWPLDEA